MKNVVALILGGGRGTRLYPLTKFRAKPAVPIGGKYRLIDIPLSNCINSGIGQMYVLTQFNSASLHHHIHSFHFDNFNGGFAEILAAQQTNKAGTWYQGTADAVRQNLSFFQGRNAEYVLILSGDQLYHMDFQRMLRTHIKSGADVTISTVPVERSQASGLGIMCLDAAGRVSGFLEKPKTDAELQHVQTSTEWIERHGIAARGRQFLASMGIYLFNRKTLVEVLEKTPYTDFGKEVFPATIRTKKVQVHLFDGYWEDIGTIRAFYDANLAMAKENPPFVLSRPEWRTFTEPRFLPPTRMDGAAVHSSLIADGSEIGEGAVIENSIIGVRCKIGKGVKIRNSILMGCDYYQTKSEIDECLHNGMPVLGIGNNTVIEGAIIDKDCHIGEQVKIANHNHVADCQEKPFGMIRDGIICIQKKAVIPDGWSLS
ncbi:MAG: glucose-1-phosphate adenylyltransferase [Planctomycetaceae bacterium]|nr:glucose-1-phosphate adenylyltransferase [Planctomycetaceae bacterium]